MRRRVARALELADLLKVAAEELVSIENRLEELDAKTPEQQFVGEHKAWSVEGPRLRVQRERKRAACEALKKELDAMNAASGLFPKQQLKQIRAFAARVNKKKAYRKRVKLRLRAEASICRAADTSTGVDKAPTTESKLKPMTSTEGKQLCAEKPMSSPRSPNVPPVNRQATFYLSGKEGISPKQSLDPETLTFDALVAARRAWDSYIVVQRTPGASTIPPHFIPPPSTPSAQWAIYAYSS
ncbi:uncharacterized protein KRP23_11534 [Phytophthora ramorum]|uniref:uncharacterized protein n=1 Tax=Phytophthora ramorum TaxID=164328 RepID=UPI0030AB90F3|nr:hypothetical protein KRP23_11534 [Phytophthora ramorum]